MKNKKRLIIFAILIIIILIAGFFVIKYLKSQEKNVIEEYTPQEEINEEQFRQTIVSLYFLDKETKQVMPEARLVDVIEILNSPYEKLVQLLIEGPKNDKLQSVIPEGTKLLKAEINGECVTLDFSAELLNYNKEVENMKQHLINSIVNTLTELTEVNSVKILIDGNENNEFNEIYTRAKSEL